MPDFTIDKVRWHTETPRNYEFDNGIIYKYFEHIINYQEATNLFVRPLNEGDREITEDTKIMASDLTEEGVLVVKATYRKWMDKVVDGEISPGDYRLLNKALKKIRDTAG